MLWKKAVLCSAFACLIFSTRIEFITQLHEYFCKHRGLLCQTTAEVGDSDHGQEEEGQFQWQC